MTSDAELARVALHEAFLKTGHSVSHAEGVLALLVADALDTLAADIYNADPDPAFPHRQEFYNAGVSPWLSEKARQAREATQ